MVQPHRAISLWYLSLILCVLHPLSGCDASPTQAGSLQIIEPAEHKLLAPPAISSSTQPIDDNLENSVAIAKSPFSYPHQKRRLTTIKPPPSNVTLTSLLSHPKFFPPSSNRHHVTLRRLSQTLPVSLPTITTIIERLYELIAFYLLDLDELNDLEPDLVFTYGMLKLEFFSMAEYMSVQAVKAVVRRLGQVVQQGLTGFAVGEVWDVTAAVGVIFALGLV